MIMGEQYKKKICVSNSGLEAELALKQVVLLRVSFTKISIMILLGIFTFGVYLIISQIKPKLWKKMIFNYCKQIEEASHVEINCEKRIYFEYLNIKYFYENQTEQFNALSLNIDKKTLNEILKSRPLTFEEIQINQYLYGQNQIIIQIPNYFSYLLQELLKPLSWLLNFGILIWFFYGYFLFVGITLISTLITYSIIYLFVRNTKIQLKNSCKHNLNIKVLRENKIQLTTSQDIYPGDIVLLDKPITLPFDCVILKGVIQVNESNLTGESISVIKVPIQRNKTQNFYYNKNVTNLLIVGTTIVKLEDDETKVLVIRTGFYSFKGQLIRSILFPSPQNFAYFVEGYKLCLFVALVSLIAYLSTVPTFILMSLPEKIIIFRFFEIIVNSFPPGIPLLILQSIFFSFAKLRKKQIFGSDTSQAIQAGRVTTICFDKTGTLTETDVDFIGYQSPCSQNLDASQNGDKTCILFKLLSICHQAYEINGTFIGDPIDVKILQFSGWKIYNDRTRDQRYSKYQNEKVYCLQVNEFHSEYQSMSVLVEDLADPDNKYIFMKGSPESIFQKLDDQTDKQQIEYQLNKLISQGFRVLAAGYKKVPNREFQNILKFNRKEQEQGISLLCFLVFKNSLKKKTQKVINELSNADYNLKVVSGDNPFTVYNIARESQLLKLPGKNLLLIDKCDKAKDYFTITEIQNEGQKNAKIFQAENSQDILLQQIKYCTEASARGINLCLTGSAQHFLENCKSQSTYSLKTSVSFQKSGSFQNNTFDKKFELFYNFLIKYCQIFARTSPVQKANVIKQLKLNGEIVCMVGDGVNDCQAIKEADLGISFSDSDGQFSALFISKNKEIDCVKEILLEGRITLSVASESFKGYIQLLALRYICFLALQYYFSSLNEFQLVFNIYFGFLPIFWFSGLGQAPTIIKKYTQTNTISSYKNFVSLMLGFVIQIIAITSCLIILQADESYQEPTNYYNNSFFYQCQQNTVIYFYLSIMVCYTILSNYISEPIKCPIYKNIYSFFFLALQLIYGNLIILFPKLNINFLYLVEIEDFFTRFYLFLVLNGLGILQLLLEKKFVQKWIQKKFEEKSDLLKKKLLRHYIDDIIS
ncbi:hypothetical protein ABPG72_019266 [Tetrahymena utriculariae]